jgi:hypothetical protein
MKPACRLVSLIALLSTLLGACGGGGGGGSSGTPPSAPAVSLSVASLNYGAIVIASNASKSVTVQNSGTAALTIASGAITISGADAAEFSQTKDCATSLAPNASCTITVTFTAGAIGSKSATLSIATNAAGSPSTVPLLGSVSEANALAVKVDMGPLASTNPTANVIYADITFCTPNSTTACRTVNHIQVDTGSYGLRVFKSALDAASGPAVVPTTALDATSGNALFECVQYADGYTWGSVVTVDVKIGTRVLHGLRIQLTGANAPTGTVPADCSAGMTNENQVSAFGANGILGIGGFLQDCGAGCTDPNNPYPGTYYACPSTSACVGAGVDLASQVQNPISLLASDSNGVLLDLPAVSPPGAATLNGTIYFGLNTQTNNTLGSGTHWFALSPADGTLITDFNGTTMTRSIIDSGSNAYFFDSTIHVCTSTLAKGFYCPATIQSLNATITGQSGTTAAYPVSFQIDSADTLFTNSPNNAVFPTLGGANTSIPTLFGAFDWGLPFFYGRKVWVLFENSPGPSGSGVSVGPALAF